MLHPHIRREIAARYHKQLPDQVRAYLKSRGIPSTIVERERLGWNGERVVIPVFGRDREVLGFRYAGMSDAAADIHSDIQLGVQLYGLDRLLSAPRRVVICDGEFDRLVLEAHGIAAVCSTDPIVFLEEWLPNFRAVKHVYVCFRRSLTGAAAARRVERLLPRAVVVTLPPDVGEGGGISDYFVGLRMTKVDFEVMLANAAVARNDPSDRPPQVDVPQPKDKSVRKRAENVRRAVRLHEVVSEIVELEADGARLIAHCPFHDDRERSFAVYPETDVYSCRVCGAAGDVVQFVMDKESKTLGQALEMLEDFSVTRELYGGS